LKNLKLCHFGILVLFMLLALTACDDFYSTTYGTERDYNPDKIHLTADNLNEWLDAAIGRPKLAKVLSVKIKEMVISGKLSEQDMQKFQEAGVKIAIEASGIGTIFLSNVGDVINAAQDGEPEAVITLITDILEDFKKAGGPDAARDLAGIVLADPENYFSNAGNGDVSMVVLVLTLSVICDISEIDTENLTLEDLNMQKDEDGVITGIQEELLSPELETLIYFLKGEIDDNSLAGGILNLPPSH